MDTRVLAIVLLFIISLGVGSSYAQSSPDQEVSKYNVYLTLVIRDSNGHLLAYIEPTIKYMYAPKLFINYVNSKPKSMVDIDGKEFEQIQFSERATFSVTHVMATYLMYMPTGVPLLDTVHDGYPVVPGDTITAYWTILKPAA